MEQAHEWWASQGIQGPDMGLFLFWRVTMITSNRMYEAQELLDITQRGGDIFGNTAKGIIHWMDKYADSRAAGPGAR